MPFGAQRAPQRAALDVLEPTGQTPTYELFIARFSEHAEGRQVLLAGEIPRDGEITAGRLTAQTILAPGPCPVPSLVVPHVGEALGLAEHRYITGAALNRPLRCLKDGDACRLSTVT